MERAKSILSEITTHMKYARFIESLNRRETWYEIVKRNKDMHIKKFPHLEEEINEMYEFVLSKKVLPSMRSMQFAGKAIEYNPARIFNCSYMPVDSLASFSEAMFLLLSGVGVGFSVQSHHVNQLPLIKQPKSKTRKRFLIEDSIEGWADAVKYLFKCYTGSHNQAPDFDFSSIREKGAMLVTSGGKAPGSEPLKICLKKIESILCSVDSGVGLSTIQCHDLMCIIADAVLAGGIRRAALISLFDYDDESMLNCKSGSWWETAEHRGRANNSAVLKRGEITKPQFLYLWKKIQDSGSGEPGIYWTNNIDWGTNPCCFTGETIVAVADGRNGVTIKQLAKESNGKISFPVYCARERKIKNQHGEQKSNKFQGWKTEVKNAVAYSNGFKETIKVTLSDGSSFKCTPEHLIATKGGEWIRAIDSKGIIVEKFFTNCDNYRTINSNTNGSQRQYRMIWEFYNGQKPEGFHIDHIKNNVGDFIDNLQLLSDVEHNKKTSSERLGDDNTIYKIKDKEKWLDTLSSNSQMSNNSRYCGLSNKELFDIAMSCKSSGLRITFKNLNKFDAKFPSSFSKNRFGGKLSNLVSQVESGVFSDDFEYTPKPSQETQKFVQQPLTVVNIENAESEEVFDLTVEENSNFFIITNTEDDNYNSCSGLLVHNCEIALKPYQFCNLVEINVASVTSEEDFKERLVAATRIATLQASYTNFHYLRPIWAETTEAEALLGVSMTGIASGNIEKHNIDLKFAASLSKVTNEVFAKKIGVNPAARITCVKPAGTTSLVLGTSSGIHSYHSKYYIRRLRVKKNEPIYTHLLRNHPELVKDEYFNPSETAVIEVPQFSGHDAITRHEETAIDLLNRVKFVSENWVKYGHKEGSNTHNVSATISVKEQDWTEVGDWMWDNREIYNGLSVLPFDGGTYIQAPFEEITYDKYLELISSLNDVDLSLIKEFEDKTDLQAEAACAGGACEL